MFFLVRYYGGTKLGNQQFIAFREVATKALEINPNNAITGVIQTVTVQEDERPRPRPLSPAPRGRRFPSYRNRIRGSATARKTLVQRGQDNRRNKQYKGMLEERNGESRFDYINGEEWSKEWPTVNQARQHQQAVHTERW